MAQIQGTVPVDGQRRLIHWVRQSMASPRWWRARPEVIRARARVGALSPGWRTPLRTSCWVVGSPTAPGGAAPGVSMVLVPLTSNCGPGKFCCGDPYVVVPALEDCTPDLRRGVVAVCRWEGEIVVGCSEAGGAVACFHCSR